MGTGPVGAPRPLRERPEPQPAGTALVHVPREAPAASVAPRRLGPWTWPSALARPSRTLPVVVAVLALAVGAVVVHGSSAAGPGPGEALVEVDGSVVVHRSGGGVDVVTDRTRLEPGDRLTVRSGTAELELADAVRFSARAAAGSVPATDLTMARVPTLRAGPLLVVAPRGTRIAAGAGAMRLADSGAARVTRTTAVGVDVFRGGAVLSSAGVEQSVPALRAAEIVAAGELSGTRPVDYHAADAWDRRYLGPALTLDRQLSSLVSGMRADRVDGADLARRLRFGASGAPSTSALRTLLAHRKGALDAAVGVAVVGAGRGGSFEARWARAFRFHDAGAPWGLVAMDAGADPDAVVDALGRALQIGRAHV